jgi:hypothetical protein
VWDQVCPYPLCMGHWRTINIPSPSAAWSSICYQPWHLFPTKALTRIFFTRTKMQVLKRMEIRLEDA